nr:hypothetical protein [Tanacetum cinerariifolium]
MFLNVEQLEKQLDKEYFQEIGSMATFNVLETQFQMFITNRDYLNDEYVAMTRSYFIQYTGHATLEFHETLIQHLESIKKSIDERVQLKREYDSWVNERQMQTTEEKDTSSISGNDAHDDDAYIIPIYDEELMAEVQMTAEIDVFAIGQQHTEQPEFNNEGKKCVFSANHDSCVPKFLKEVNSRAKVPSNKTTNRNKPVEQIGVPHKQERQIPTGHMFSIQKTSIMQKKTMTPRSYLRWKQTGKIFKTVGLRWVPTGKIFTSSTTKVDNEPLNGSNADITNQYKCEQNLDVSACTSNLSASTSFNPKEEGLRVCSKLRLHDYINEQSSSKLVQTLYLQQSRQLHHDKYADAPSQHELDILFGPLYDEFFNAGSNPSTNNQSTSAPSTHTNVHAEENKNDQAEEGEQIQDDEFTNPLCAPTQEEAESSSHNIGNSNVPSFNQPIVSEYRWTKDHPLEQVRGNPSRPVQTR